MQFKTQEQHFKETLKNTIEQKIQLKYTYTKKTNNIFQRTDCH